MTEYKARIERKRKQLAAEDWAKGIREIQLHSTNSMWYEPNPVKVKTRKVLDVVYNDGRITRDDLEIVPSQYKGEELIDRWEHLDGL